MIPARAVVNLHAHLAAKYRAYCVATNLDGRLGSTRRRRDEARRGYDGALILAAPKLGIVPDRIDGRLWNYREIEAALEVAFPGWREAVRASIPDRRPHRYVKRSSKWGRR